MKKPHTEFLLTEHDWIFERIKAWVRLLESSIYAKREPLDIEFCPVGNQGDMVYSLERQYERLALGSQWGSAWDYGWFRFKGIVPKDWQGQSVAALIDLEGEVSLFDPKGAITRRLTWGSAFGVHCHVEDVPLFDSCRGGERVEITAQAWASSIVGMDQPLDPEPDQPAKGGSHNPRVKTAHLSILRPEVRQLLWDVEILLGVAREALPHSARRAKVLKALLEACVAWQDNPERSSQAREKLKAELARPATSSSLEAVAIGHAHIDTGWLWRIRDSIGKCARTFASQLELIEKYPGYRFGASSAQHYAFIKENYPELHERIRRQVKAGTWELQGGMWVEPDTNLPSGEALIRQILYGQQFFRQEFGVECEVAWLPDVFGLTAALPQILSKSGIRFLLTKKPHWSRVNHYPDTTFRWCGHDGSGILVHLLPQARDYNGLMRVEDLIGAERGFTEKGEFDKFIYTVGIGDGGGGPSEVHLERASRMASLEGVPRVRFGDSREVFMAFEAQSQKLKKKKGDLYVEGHRGTYTTQARLKAANRKLEVLLVQMEQLFCMLPAAEYPKEEFRQMWQTVLLHQFHDILPGSSIREVNEDAERTYAQVFAKIAELQQRFAGHLARDAKTISFFNGLNQPWSGAISSSAALDFGGGSLPSQAEPDGQTVTLVSLPALSLSALRKAGKAQQTTELNKPILENQWLRCSFDKNGQLLSVLDKESGRELVPDCRPGNQLALYVDRPIDWDAWDVDHFYRGELLETAKASGPWSGWSGPVRSVLVFNLKIGNSNVIQRCILEANSKRIDFETDVQWQERHRMLRVGFGCNEPAKQARCEIQHGFIERPTHKNTPYEEARFEVPCHRYACLLGDDCGIAILNDSKYGVRIEENLLELALLRATTYPDHSADQGTHRFTYSFVPLASADDFPNVPRSAAELNVKPVQLEGYAPGNLRIPVALEGDAVSVETIKRTESGQNLLLRVAEVQGRKSSIRIKGSWLRADLMERPAEALPEGEVIQLQPFEVLTLVGA